MFDKTDLEKLYQSQVKNDLDDFPLPSRFLFLNDKKVLFISKARNEYRLYSSSITGFKAFRTTKTFDILFFNKDLQLVKNEFLKYVKELCL